MQWLLDGENAWTRPGLIAYWAALALVSVAGWSRQLIRARRHRRYVVPNVAVANKGKEKEATAKAMASGASSSLTSPGIQGQGGAGVSGVASQMMDAADQRIPTLSVNARRKFFHALAVVMFVPGIAVDVRFHFQFSQSAEWRSV